MSKLFPVNKIEPFTKLTPEQQAKVDFAMSIDFEPLKHHISEQLGVAVEMDTIELDIVRSELLLQFGTSSVLSGAGFFSSVLKSCNVISFGSGIKKDTLDDFITEEFRYWASVSLSYMHATGGENCMGIASTYYTENRGWVYLPVRMIEDDEE